MELWNHLQYGGKIRLYCWLHPNPCLLQGRLRPQKHSAWRFPDSSFCRNEAGVCSSKALRRALSLDLGPGRGKRSPLAIHPRSSQSTDGYRQASGRSLRKLNRPRGVPQYCWSLQRETTGGRLSTSGSPYRGSHFPYFTATPLKKFPNYCILYSQGRQGLEDWLSLPWPCHLASWDVDVLTCKNGHIEGAVRTAQGSTRLGAICSSLWTATLRLTLRYSMAGLVS